MYEKIVNNIVNESRKITRRSVSKAKIEYTKKVAKTLSDSVGLITKPVISPTVVQSQNEQKRKIPIAPPVQKNKRYPTKRVNFDDGVTWLQ